MDVKDASEAVACGEEIYVSNQTGPVQWYDGKTWRAFTVPGRTGKRGRIAVCGAKTLLFVETDESGKALLGWRKKAGSEWQGPRTLVTEKTEICSVAFQRYAPEAFAPVAYLCVSPDSARVKAAMGRGRHYDIIHGFDQYPPGKTPLEPWIKVLKVPAGDGLWD
jgi:hypothetical protein